MQRGARSVSDGTGDLPWPRGAKGRNHPQESQRMRRYPMESRGFVARLALNGNVLVDIGNGTPSWRAQVDRD